MLYNDESRDVVAQAVVDDMDFSDMVDFIFNNMVLGIQTDYDLFQRNVEWHMKDAEGYQVVRPNENISNIGSKDVVKDFTSHPDRWYINYYRCKDCDIEWEMEWDADCDDKCPKCHSEYTPYKSEEFNED